MGIVARCRSIFSTTLLVTCYWTASTGVAQPVPNPNFSQRTLRVDRVDAEVGQTILEQVRNKFGIEIGPVQNKGSSTRILNGDTVSVADQMRFGLVTVNLGCSGTLMRNDWVITAGHCIPKGLPRAGTAVLNGVSRAADRIYEFGDSDARGMDVALLHLSSPFPLPAGQDRYHIDVARVDGNDLRDQIVVIYGQGFNRTASGIAGPTGLGTYRLGIMKITPSSTAFFSRNMLLEAKPVFNFGACSFGDSGGPIFVNVSGTRELASIVQTGDTTCAGPAQCVGSNTTEIRSCKGPKLYESWEAFLDIMGTPWNAANESELFDVGGAEWASTKQINGSLDTNVQSWAAVARSANLMCFNRGFASGHFNGHELGGKFGLACAGVSGATWRDAKSAEISSTPWPFADVNTATWSQATRAAARICEQGGFVGGHFNGNIVDASGGGKLMGLICYRGGARRLDASRAQLSAEFDSPDHASWAQAGRRANNFCQLQGFRSGFLNGHFTPDGKMGVICH